MNKLYWTLGLIMALGLVGGFTPRAHADELSCPEGQEVQSVEVEPEQVIHHDAVTHEEVVTPAYDEFVYVGHENGEWDFYFDFGGAYTRHHTGPGGHYEYTYVGEGNGFYSPTTLGGDAYDKVHHDAVTETVVDEEAFDEVIPAVFEDQCVDIEQEPEPEPTDLCANIEGVQEEVPEGLVQDGENCVEQEPEQPVQQQQAPATDHHSEGGSVYSQLCNTFRSFGVGFCPANYDVANAPQYQQLLALIFEYLKLGGK